MNMYWESGITGEDIENYSVCVKSPNGTINKIKDEMHFLNYDKVFVCNIVPKTLDDFSYKIRTGTPVRYVDLDVYYKNINGNYID